MLNLKSFTVLATLFVAASAAQTAAPTCATSSTCAADQLTAVKCADMACACAIETFGVDLETCFAKVCDVADTALAVDYVLGTCPEAGAVSSEVATSEAAAEATKTASEAGETLSTEAAKTDTAAIHASTKATAATAAATTTKASTTAVAATAAATVKSSGNQLVATVGMGLSALAGAIWLL